MFHCATRSTRRKKYTVPPNNYPIRAFGALLDMLPNKVQPVYYSHSYPFDLLSVFCSLLKKHQI